MLCVVFLRGPARAVRNLGGIAAEPSGASLVAIAPRSPAGSHFLYLGQLALVSLDFEARRSTRARSPTKAFSHARPPTQVAPSARALGARHPRRAAASGGKSLSSPSSLPPTLTSKLTTTMHRTKSAVHPPPPGPTPGAYLAGRHQLNRCRYLWRPGGRRGSASLAAVRH